jgi:hypothetical protein
VHAEGNHYELLGMAPPPFTAELTTGADGLVPVNGLTNDDWFLFDFAKPGYHPTVLGQFDGKWRTTCVRENDLIRSTPMDRFVVVLMYRYPTTVPSTIPSGMHESADTP